jgi:Protein kinase domain
MRGNPERIGPFHVIRRLGAGGMGTVYEARHPDLPRSLALNVISPTALSAQSLARFWREAEALSQVRHPGVVTIHELGRSPQGPYMAQSLVEGQTLAEVLEEHPRGLAPDDAARILRALADAVAAVHGAGILHRDLKPANVILKPDRQPVLLDFGLAREVDAETLTRTGDLVGTPMYLSPEQADGTPGAELTPAVDVYGLGTLLYQLLVGQTPFAPGSLVNMVAAILHQEPKWPSHLGVPVSPALEAILRVCMAKVPGQRYAGAADLRDDLDRYLAGEPPQAMARLGLVQRRRRLRAAWAPAAGLCLALGVLALGAWAAGALSSEPVRSPPARDPGPTRRLPPAPTAATSEDPATGPALWDLAPGDRFRLRSWYAESDHQATLGLGVWFRAVVDDERDGGLVLSLTIEAVLTTLGAATLNDLSLASRYDTREPTPDHSLGGVQAAVGGVIDLWLDPRTGAVRVQGTDAIGRAILEHAHQRGLPLPLGYDATIETTFTDAFLARALATLLHVQPTPGTSTPLPWIQLSSGASRRYEVHEEPRLPVLPTVSAYYRPASDHRFRVRGECHYARGRLVSSRAEQQLVGRDVEGAIAPLGITFVSRTVWETHLEPE